MRYYYVYALFILLGQAHGLTYYFGPLPPQLCGSGRGMSCIGVTKPCGRCKAFHPKGQTLQACPKRTILLMGTALKSAFLWGGILLLALKLFVRFGSEDLTALSSRQRGRPTYALCAFCNFRPTSLREVPPLCFISLSSWFLTLLN